MIHEVGLRQYHGAFGEVVAFDCATACGDQAGLVRFYCFDAERVRG